MSALASAHRLVVVTGASSGIGAAAVRAFCAAGYPVLALARRKPRLDALVAEILGAGDLAGADPGELQSTYNFL